MGRLGAAAVVLAMLAAACSGGDDGAGADDEAGADTGATPTDLGCDGTLEAPAPQFVVDDCGRVLILRGTNVEGGNKGSAVDDDHLPDSFDSQQHLGQFGWNSVRFLISWGAVEPTQGSYDEDYLDELETWMDFYAEQGIHVVLDMHQDVYGWAVGGNGAPDWAVITDGLEVQPIDEGQPWYLAAVDPAAQAAYQNFWDPERGHPELQDHFFGAWSHVAERFADHPAIIGYDLLNEPVFANGDFDETLAIQAQAAAGTFRNPRLTAFTQRGIETIRAADDDGWILVEPTSLLNAFPYAGDLDASQISDHRAAGPRLGYAPHFYELNVHDGLGYAADSPYIAQWEDFRTGEAEALQATLYMGEFGGPPDQERMDEYIDETLTMADRAMAGWAQWSWDPAQEAEGSWSPVTVDGELTRNGERLLRVQPRAVAGVPESFSWDAATSVFRMSWSERDGVQGPTELAAPVGDWDGEVEVVLDGEVVETTVDEERGIMTVEPTAEGSAHEVCVRWGAGAGAC
jgi:endoglycosylceramidase